MLLIIIAVILAFPLAYFFIHDWLQQFAYRTDIHLMTFVLAALLALGITLITIAYHTLRAASANPATSLREE
jgi:putative ABC transport system permease protein